jgi:hypothetical protein
MQVLRFLPARRRKYGVSRLGGFMSLHFQVYAEFTLTQGKPQLVGTSIFSTTAACTTIPISGNSVLKHYRIFPTLKIAHSYIAYLHGVYPHSPALPPVLDGNQKELFTEVSK